MLPLSPPAYGRVTALLDAVPFNTLFARAVTNGQVPGQVFVDDLARPAACYVRHPHGMALLAGMTGVAAFHASLEAYLREVAGRAHDEWLQVSPAAWCERAGEWVQAHPRASEHVRLNFTFSPERFAERPPAPELPGTRIVQLDGAMFDAFDGSVVPKDFWPDAVAFSRNGVGFVLLEDGQPAATAFSAFVQGRQVELGIETTPASRGKGFALQVCAALITHCLTAGLEPVWSCRAGNEGSCKLARKLGFVQTARLPYYHFSG